MIEIIPAILPPTLEDLQSKLEMLRGLTEQVQVDVVDGVFARNKTWPYSETESFEKIITEEEGLPLWEEFNFEFDMMVEHPEREVEKFIEAGADRLVIHATSTGSLEAVRKLQETRTGDFAVLVGVAVGAESQVEDLQKFDGLFDYIQVMGIEKVGFQGQPFDQRCLSLIKELRTKYPNTTIQVDGAVAEHVHELVSAGANRLIVGSKIIHSEDPESELKRLYTEANVGSRKTN
jgi:ribulose-phosphate 3-epimerase